jgi:hypothetical protein
MIINANDSDSLNNPCDDISDKIGEWLNVKEKKNKSENDEFKLDTNRPNDMEPNTILGWIFGKKDGNQ